MSKTARGPILVTDAHELAGLGTVRSLGRAGFAVTLAIPDHVRRCAAESSRYAGRTLHYPDPWKRHAEFGAWLERQSASGDWLRIFPIAEAAIAAAAAVRTKDPTAPLLLPDDRSLAYASSRFRATGAALEAGIPCPKTLFVLPTMSDGDLGDALKAMSLPLVVRSDNRLTKDGEYLRAIMQLQTTRESVRRSLDGFRSREEAVLVQEFIPGFGIGASFLRLHGRSLLEFSHRRLHEVPYGGGYSSLRVSTHDPRALGFGRSLLASIDYAGIAMVEFRRDTATGVAYFMEINGRVWGSIALALHAGLDFPAAYVNAELGEEPDELQPSYRTGITCRHVPADVVHVLSAIRDPRLGLREKIWKLGEFALLGANPRIRHDCLWRTDPGPGFAAARGLAATFVRRAARRRRRNAARTQGDAAESQSNGQREGNTILFLCYGNICRSPFAATFWNEKLRCADARLPLARSAGFVEEPNRRTPATIAQVVRDAFDVDLTAHRSRHVTESDVNSAAAIFVMDAKNFADLKRRFPRAVDRTFFLGASSDLAEAAIADPFEMREVGDVHAVFDKIARSARALAVRLAESAPPK
jgi:protein-tyrosine-phosphatase